MQNWGGDEQLLVRQLHPQASRSHLREEKYYGCLCCGFDPYAEALMIIGLVPGTSNTMPNLRSLGGQSPSFGRGGTSIADLYIGYE